MTNDTTTETADVNVRNEGSLFLFYPMTAEAHEWLNDNTDGTWWGGALVVEHRYAHDLAQGMIDAGYTVR